jgi:hypothetical protein
MPYEAFRKRWEVLEPVQLYFLVLVCVQIDMAGWQEMRQIRVRG